MAKISIILAFAAAGQTLASSLRETAVKKLAPDTTTAAICGNGVIEVGEECDGGPCCTSDCTFASFGSTCVSTLPTGAVASGMCVEAECVSYEAQCSAAGELFGISFDAKPCKMGANTDPCQMLTCEENDQCREYSLGDDNIPLTVQPGTPCGDASMCWDGVCTPVAEVAAKEAKSSSADPSQAEVEPVSTDEGSDGRLLSSGTYYQIKNPASGRCMTISHDGNLYTQVCHGGWSQRFRIDAHWRIVAGSSNQCVDYNLFNGNLYLHDCHGGNNQRFFIDWRNRIVTWHNGHCVDRHLHSNNLYMHSCHMGSNQVFHFERV